MRRQPLYRCLKCCVAETSTSSVLVDANDDTRCRLTSVDFHAANVLHVRWLTNSDEEFATNATNDCLLRIGLVYETLNEPVDCNSLHSIADVRGVGGVSVDAGPGIDPIFIVFSRAN
jgi:hypothetical protein